MPEDLPTYLIGDTIRLRLEIEHEVNLKDVWANFRQRGAAEEPQVFGISLKEITMIAWHGEGRYSEAILEKQVKRADPPSGEYELVDVRGLPYGTPDTHCQESKVLVLNAPTDVGLRIAETPAITTPEVTKMELGIRPPEISSE
jgi:hypothetical protein